MFGFGRQLLGPKLPWTVRALPTGRSGSYNSVVASMSNLSDCKHDTLDLCTTNFPSFSFTTLESLIHNDLIPPTGSVLFNGRENLFVPGALEGCHVLVLGCKSGVEAYTCSALVGACGKVTAVDNVDEVNEAIKYLDWQTKSFGYTTPNIRFHSGKCSDLDFLESLSVDVILSVSSMNSYSEKESILQECYRVMKEGGELYFSDVFSDRRTEPVVSFNAFSSTYLTNSLYYQDFRRMMNRAGFLDVRKISVEDVTDVFSPTSHFENYDCRYNLCTIRAFKISSLEDRPEDFDQVAIYTGSSSHFLLDDDYSFDVGCPVSVCGNTADILRRSRYNRDFKVSERGRHLGSFVQVQRKLEFPKNTGLESVICKQEFCRY
eukprot:TRINITY_DN5035_c0_g1_i15.p1 TRINITY_DN5035_c0_g1~~TRINITY_DN5035_c0_g1_i15.p1  ORF type:complete len:376 (+),score=77.85 TRINITY_DN5035_c0_g1_i15:102-1229(+)